MLKRTAAFSAALFFFSSLSAASAETIELVTYYPSVAGGNIESDRIHAGRATIGDDPYSLTDPANLPGGTLLVADRLGVGLGLNLPLGPLHVVGRDDAAESVLFLPGADTAEDGAPDIRVGIGAANPQPVPGVAGSGLEVRTDITVSGPDNANVSSINWVQDNNGPWWHFSLRNSGNLEMHARAAANQAGSEIPLAMTLTGNVGIGTTTPMSNIGNGSLQRSLDVNGWILSRSNGANTWGDGASRVGVLSGNDQTNAWWISANPNNTFGIHQGGVGDRLTVLQNGNVGIGTTNPGNKLEINGNVYAVTGNVNSEFGTLSHGVRTILQSISNPVGRVGTVSNHDLELTTNNHPWYRLTTGGAWNFQSDVRTKTDIRPIPNALERISKIRGVNFRWKEKRLDKGMRMGVIGQEVEKVFPELVSTDESGKKWVAYLELNAALIEAVKELKGQVGELEAKNQKLEREVESLKTSSR